MSAWPPFFGKERKSSARSGRNSKSTKASTGARRGAVGPRATPPCPGPLRGPAQTHAAPAEEAVGADPTQTIPAAITTLVTPPPSAAGDVGHRGRVALKAAERLVVDPRLGER